jgi:peptidoglycan hydrolase CwlO-like protein
MSDTELTAIFVLLSTFATSIEDILPYEGSSSIFWQAVYITIIGLMCTWGFTLMKNQEWFNFGLIALVIVLLFFSLRRTIKKGQDKDRKEQIDLMKKTIENAIEPLTQTMVNGLNEIKEEIKNQQQPITELTTAVKDLTQEIKKLKGE